MLPHMHFRGKAFRFTAIYPDGKQEMLLDVPHYDFNWQNVYWLAEPKLMPAGTRFGAKPSSTTRRTTCRIPTRRARCTGATRRGTK